MPTDGLVNLVIKPLVDDQTTKEKVNQAPEVEGELSGGNVGLVFGVIGRVLVLVTAKGGVQVSGQQGHVDEDVGDLGGPVVEGDSHY